MSFKNTVLTALFQTHKKQLYQLDFLKTQQFYKASLSHF